MLYRDSDQFPPFLTLQKFVCVMTAVAFAWLPCIRPANASANIQSNGELRFELPANGNLRFEIPGNANATLVADSKTGGVMSSIDALPVNRGASPQLQGRIGSGAASVRLYSQAGNINVSAVTATTARTVSSAPTRTVPLG